MIKASELAGFFAAHAIWCVSDGDPLIPMLAYTTEHGERRMERLMDGDVEKAVAVGQQRLVENPMDANEAALLFDGRIEVDNEKTDAIIIEVRSYFSPQSAVIIGVPYTPKSAGRFRVHKPKVLLWEGCEDFEIDHAMEAFFEGVSSHDKGAAIWNRSFGERL